MRRPWNIVDVPVYSLATYGLDQVNMNICTYVTAVSRKPKMYVIAIEHGSTTLDLLKRNDEAILQLLSVEHARLVRPLGQKKGRDFNKQAYLERSGQLTSWQGRQVLNNTNALLHLMLEEQWQTGDHDLCCFSVLKSKTFKETGVLMFKDLVDKKIILG